MTEISFEEERELHRADENLSKSVFIRFAYKTGLVRTEQGAKYLLLSIAVVGILFTFFTLSNLRNAPKPSVPDISGTPVTAQ